LQRKFGGEKWYKALTLDNDSFFGYYPHTGEASETVVIVEDVLSALKCREVADTIALCTTSIRPLAVRRVLEKGYKEAVIFLDADNPTVRMNARKIARKLSFLRTRIIETGRDPKYYDVEALKALIGG
jgi:hypothetical protein